MLVFYKLRSEEESVDVKRKDNLFVYLLFLIYFLVIVVNGF